MPAASSAFTFDPLRHERELTAVIDAVRAAGRLDAPGLDRILRRHPRGGRGVFSKSQLIRGFRALAPRHGWNDEAGFVARLRMKPVRTLSGVAPVTVLTQPWPCPGRCVFCPSDVRMPKSYLSREPGAQRAAQHDFDPYAQTMARLVAYHHTGHRVDKVELIVLGGTWSAYPESYQLGFLERCFAALDDFAGERAEELGHAVRPVGSRIAEAAAATGAAVDGAAVGGGPDGAAGEGLYNRTIAALRRTMGAGDGPRATWDELAAAQRRNETAAARCVGLSLETRPDLVDAAEVRRLRRLGATKIQVGIQSLDDAVLAANRRGHDVAASRRALTLLRAAGFKLHVHWMPNLLGSDPERDIADYRRLFADPAIRPDELKIYPCSLVESAELVRFHRSGAWRPYERQELLDVLVECLAATPRWCRVTRMVRDIPGDDILVGNRTTNFRQVVAEEMARRGVRSVDIREREIRDRMSSSPPRLRQSEYATSLGREIFLEMVTAGDRLLGFLRLALPAPGATPPIDELAGAALLREVHVYGGVVALAAGEEADGEGATVQHRGLGRRLVERAATLAREAGYGRLAVISAVGAREYYRRLGFRDGELYQHRPLGEGGRPPGERREGGG